MNQRETILKKLDSLSFLPSAAVQAIPLFQDPDVSIPKLARVIELDPSLTSNVLRLSNSAFFGSPRSVRSVREAIVRQGIDQVFRSVMAAAMGSLGKVAVKGYDLSRGKLWEHSVAVAIGVEEMAKVLGLKAPEYAFTAGQLHDVGKVALGTFVEVDAAPITKLAFDKEISFERAERQVLGIDHAEVGAALLEKWQLPVEIVEAVRWHHAPEEFTGDDPLVVDLVHAADGFMLTGGIGAGVDGLNYHRSEESIARLGVTAKDYQFVSCKALDGLEEARKLMLETSRR